MKTKHEGFQFLQESHLEAHKRRQTSEEGAYFSECVVCESILKC